jgi:hypothetical protein
MQLLDIVLVCQYFIVISVEQSLEASQSQSYVNMYYYTTCKLDRTLYTFMVSFTLTALCVHFLTGLGLIPQGSAFDVQCSLQTSNLMCNTARKTTYTCCIAGGSRSVCFVRFTKCTSLLQRRMFVMSDAIGMKSTETPVILNTIAKRVQFCQCRTRLNMLSN